MTSQNKWDRIAATKPFAELLTAKARFIVPATVFFLVYYFTLPILVGFAPDFMKRRVLGPLNIAYLYALSEFFMTWILAAIYMRMAAKFDRMAAAILRDAEEK